VCVEEFALGLASVASLSIPLSWSIAVDCVARSTSHHNWGPRNGNQRARPLFVAKAGGTPKNNLTLWDYQHYILKRVEAGLLTWVPAVSLVRSSVVPNGTATFDEQWWRKKP
jgi:hypothetical protein